MCLVLLTSSSLVWTLTSLVAATLLVAGHLTPTWILGHPVTLHHNLPPTSTAALGEVEHDHITVWTGAVKVRPTLGLWLRCTIMAARKGSANIQHCGVYATTGADLPTAQVITIASLVTGTGIAVISCLFAFVSSCTRVIGSKSIFNVTGALQALAGVFCTLGLVVYPLSWNSTRVRLMCGPHTDVFSLGACSLGWALYTSIGATLLLLGCAVASVYVDNHVCSQRAEEEIRRGNHFVCIT